MRRWILIALAGVLVAASAIGLALCRSVHHYSDALAAASTEIRAEKQAQADLGHALETFDLHDPRAVEATVLPAFERYVVAADSAIARCEDVVRQDEDPKTEQYLAVLHARRRAFADARDQLTGLRGHPDQMLSKLVALAPALSRVN